MSHQSSRCDHNGRQRPPIGARSHKIASDSEDDRPSTREDTNVYIPGIVRMKNIPVTLLSLLAVLSLFYFSQRYQFKLVIELKEKDAEADKSAMIAIVTNSAADEQFPLIHNVTWSHAASVTKSGLAASSTNRSKTTPLFWHVPKSGGTTMKAFGSCMRLVVADQHGGKNKQMPPSLRIFSNKVVRYVNVDTCSLSGMHTASSLGFATKQPAQVVYSPFIREAIEYLFDDTHQAKVFTLFRDPIGRAVSLFFYLRHATWEETYSPAWQNMTIQEYAIDHADDNFITRMFTGKHGAEVLLTPDDLVQAKRFLRDKVIVGLTDQIDASLQRFGRIFGWKKNKRWKLCRLRARQGTNRFEHPSVKSGDEAWELLAAKNKYDMELYRYAQELFTLQKGAIR